MGLGCSIRIQGNYVSAVKQLQMGKIFERGVWKDLKDFNNFEDTRKQAVALKNQNYLSRRQFKLGCKTQSSVYDAEQEMWLPRNLKCMDTVIALPKIVSDLKVDHFAKSLDIGHVSNFKLSWSIPHSHRTGTYDPGSPSEITKLKKAIDVVQWQQESLYLSVFGQWSSRN